jgi:hypothetical protein
MKFILCISIVVSVLLACTPGSRIQSVNTNAYLIKDVGLFDGQKDHGIVNIVISNGTVSVISNEAITGTATTVIDGKGKYIIPGLVNAHVHLGKPVDIKAAFDVGIMAVLDMHKTNEDLATQLRPYRDSIGYAAYYSAGHAATVPGGHPTQYGVMETINDSVTPRQFVMNRIKNGADYLKLVRLSGRNRPTLDFVMIDSIIKIAHELGKQCYAHPPNNSEGFMRLVHLGIDGFVHMNFAKDTLSTEQVGFINSKNIFIIPTAIIHYKELLLLENESEEEKKLFFSHFLTKEGLGQEIHKLHNAGVSILAGTDPPNLNINYTDDLLVELQIFSEAGLSNVEVLKTATGNVAKFFDLQGVGLIEEGKPANFIFLNGNPISDLGALRKIEGIWQRGKRVR